MPLQAADNPRPLGPAKITAVKFPAAYTKANHTVLGDPRLMDVANHTLLDDDNPRLSDVALLFLDRKFHTYMQPGVDTSLEGYETIYTAGALCLL